jgi:hypothetical protein
MAWIATYAMELTAMPKRHRDDGCTHAQRIIKNGIRFTGMPAFGKVETADNIWGLVNYVRTLPSTK